MNRNQMIIVFIRRTPLQDAQRSVLKQETGIWEKCFTQGKISHNGNIGAQHDSKLLNFYYLVVLLQFPEYILLRF